MTVYLGPDHLPRWAKEVSEHLTRELSECPRHACDCCGFLTLLNPGHNESCDVCGWEDDRADKTRREQGPDAKSGPNHITLTQARANFAAFGTSDARMSMFVRDPRPEEHPASS